MKKINRYNLIFIKNTVEQVFNITTKKGKPKGETMK